MTIATTMGFYTRLNWNYQNVYFLEFGGRYDGSSRFASGQSLRIFLLSLPVMTLPRTTKLLQAMELACFSQLKVRLSYGRLGNQEWSRTMII